MSVAALFVDLPNFYSRFLSSDIDDARTLRNYFLNWFDFDRLAERLTGEYSDVWVFYSGRRFGPSSNRIQDEFLEGFIARINSQRGVTARDVNIPGQQREPASYSCAECGHEGIAEWESEKGIDASLTVRLFDSFDSWDVAYLLSGDADFVPAVESLRLRGKLVIGAGFSKAAPALVRECYDYIDLGDVFLQEDVAAYKLFCDGGVIQSWMRDELRLKDQSDYVIEPVMISFEWQKFSNTTGLSSTSRTARDNEPGNWIYRIYLMSGRQIDFKSRVAVVAEFQNKFPKNVEDIDFDRENVCLSLSTWSWGGVERRINTIQSNYSDAAWYEARHAGRGYRLTYRYDSDSKDYIVEPISE